MVAFSQASTGINTAVRRKLLWLQCRSHRSGKQAPDEEAEDSGDPVDIMDVLDHIMAAQEALAMSQ